MAIKIVQNAQLRRKKVLCVCVRAYCCVRAQLYGNKIYYDGT